MAKMTIYRLTLPVFAAFMLSFPAVNGICRAEPAAAPSSQGATPPPPADEHAQPSGEPAPAPPLRTGKRLDKLEKKVEKIDKRVTKLEKGGVSAPRALPGPEARQQPLAVTLVSKKQDVKDETLPIKMVLEFRNMTNYTLHGFSGTLVFKAEGAKGVYTRKMAYAHQLSPGDTARIEMAITSDNAKQYLKFIKARVVNVALINQKLFE